MKTRLKFLLILLTLFLLSGAVILAADEHDPLPPPLVAPDSGRAPATHIDPYTVEQEVIVLTNQLRVSLNLQPVVHNDCLALASRRHSQDMGQRNYFSHNALEPAPYGVSPWDRMAAAGYTGQPTGENIAAGNSTSQGTFNQWFNSQGHYDNMTNPDANEIGMGFAEVPGSDYTYYWTMGLGAQSGSPTCPVTAKATNLAIGGNTDTHPARPTFTWNHDTSTSVINAEQYRVVVYDGAVHMDVTVNTGDVCVDTACSYTATDIDLPDGLKQGEFDLWIGSMSSGGSTQWAGPVSFTITSGPDLVTMISPADQSTVTTAVVELTWTNDPDATWYHVYVGGPNGFQVNTWVQSADVCDVDCIYAVGPYYEGSYQWWMTAWGPQGFSIGGQYSGYVRSDFTLSTGAVDNTFSEIVDTTNKYIIVSWMHDPDASWYEFRFVSNSDGTVVYDQWHPATEYCGPTQCIAGDIWFVGGNGSYEFDMRAWGPVSTGGMGAWTTPVNVSIDHAGPGVVTARTPADGANATSPLVLSWTDDLYTLWYQVTLSGPGGYFMQNWYESNAICPNNQTCQLDEIELFPGQYSWTLRGWGWTNTITGELTTTFTVQ